MASERQVFMAGRVTPRAVIYTRRREGRRPVRGRVLLRSKPEPTVQELNAALIHDLQCPHGDACQTKGCIYYPLRRQ